MPKDFTDTGDDSSDIDSDDPYAEQLRAIKQRKKLEAINKQYNSVIERAPILTIIEKWGKILLILGILTYIIIAYSDSSAMNPDFTYYEWIQASFNVDALTDIAYYLGLFIVIFAGYAWMVFHNNKEE